MDNSRSRRRKHITVRAGEQIASCDPELPTEFFELPLTGEIVDLVVQDRLEFEETPQIVHVVKLNADVPIEIEPPRLADHAVDSQRRGERLTENGRIRRFRDEIIAGFGIRHIWTLVSD